MDNQLNAFFTPRSVAVIGASTNPSKLGHAVVQNLKEGGYNGYGRIFPINLNATEILGLKAYPSVLEVPEKIDLAVVVIPYQLVPDALEECGQKGVAAAIVISAGFREAGSEGYDRELEILQIAKHHNMRLIGPNCLGVIDTFTPLNASFAAGTPPQGPLGFMSQSGALGTAILDSSLAGRYGLSKFVSLGNKADVDEIDLLRSWGDDDQTKVIMMYSEGMSDGQAFVAAAREVTKIKPVVAIKSGVTSAGSRAVSSHTGSLAGSEQAYQAAFRQAGVIRARSMEALFDASLALGYQPHLQGNRIAIITNAGGPGILATDALERAGLTLAQFEIETIQNLKRALPGAASAANPVDVLGDALADRYRFALETVAVDPNVDGILVVLTPQAMTEIRATAQAVGELSKLIDLPVLACFMGEAKVSAGIDILQEYEVPNYAYPERAALAFEAMLQYHKIRGRPTDPFVQLEVKPETTQAILQRTLDAGRVTIGDAEARKILEEYGLKIPRSELADTPEKAVAVAAELGYPVVLKISSPDILHKTDVGGVRVNLSSPEEVRDAYELMVYRAQRYVPGAEIWGCLVQEMAPDGGLEVLVGMNRDPQFGPLVTFGLGGIYVETLKDVSFRVAPFTRREAEEMITEIRSHALLEGVRGKPAFDKDAIVDAVVRVAQMVQDFPQITELDINPLIVYPEGLGAIAIDMRLVLKPEIQESG